MIKKFYPKRDYGINVTNKDDTVPMRHIHNVVVPMQIEQKNKITDTFNHIKVKDDIVLEVIGLDKKKFEKELFNYVQKDLVQIEQETKKIFFSYKQKDILKIVKGYENNTINLSKYNKGLGIMTYNYTTSNKNLVSLVKQDLIDYDPLNKGIFMHTENVMFTRIYLDKDFIQVYLYILKNMEDDLNQRILIEKYTHITDIDRLYEDQTRKILEQIKINKIIIENNIKTKIELINYLYEN